MRKLLILVVIAAFLILPIRADPIEAPVPTGDALELIPQQQSSFLADLWTVITRALSAVQPVIGESLASSVALLSCVMLVSLVRTLPGRQSESVELVGVLATAVLLLQPAASAIRAAADTVREVSAYGKLLLPVMTAAMASQGGITSASALYSLTVVFDSVLSGMISKLLLPLVSVFLALAIGWAATGEIMLEELKKLVKGITTWALKTILYLFTGFIGVTGAVSGATDASALKATKLTMSGMIPVVGGILSDASEAVLVGAAVLKNSVGIYGMIAIIAIWIAPFLRIAIPYLILKLTAALCAALDGKRVSDLIGSFSSAMGLLLGMTGAVCIMLLISIVCFMKGVA